MKKRLLTIEDLIDFCKKQKNFTKFSSKEYGYELCVEMPAVFETAESSDDTMFMGNVLVMHTSRNLNNSFVTESAAKKAIKNIAYVPVLAAFCEIDGVRDFTDHDFEILDDGTIIYNEKQIGCVTADPAYFMDDEKIPDRKNVYAKVAIPRNYTDAAEIIERKGGTDVSVELSVNDLSWDANEGVLMLNDITILGLTCLGKDPETGRDVQPGMANAHIQIEDFSKENNSIFFTKNELVEEITQAVMKRFDNHMADLSVNNNHGKEECGLSEFEKIEDVIEKTTEEETPEVVSTFDGEDPEVGDNAVDPSEVASTISGLSDSSSEEDVAAAREAYNSMTEEQQEAFDQDVLAILTAQEARIEAANNQAAADSVVSIISSLTDESTSMQVSAARSAYDALTDDQKELVESSVLEALEEQEERVEKELVETTEDEKSKKKNYSIDYTVNMGDEVKTFSVSLMDKLRALYELVNATYGEADGTWYDIDAYDEEKLVIMHDYWNNKHYRQSYSVKKDVYSLKGDRTEVFCTYLSKDEQNALESMKSNYSEITSKLEKYESEPEKMSILNSSDYSIISDQDDFISLKKQENHFDLSVEELRSKVDDMLLQYAKSGKINFAAKVEKEEPKKDFFAFARIEHNTSFLDGLLKK